MCRYIEREVDGFFDDMRCAVYYKKSSYKTQLLVQKKGGNEILNFITGQKNKKLTVGRLEVARQWVTMVTVN